MMAAMVVVLVVTVASVAYAEIVTGTNKDDTLQGTSQADQISGYNGADTIWGKAGGDDIWGAADTDRVFGGWGAAPTGAVPRDIEISQSQLKPIHRCRPGWREEYQNSGSRGAFRDFGFGRAFGTL